MTTVPNAMSAIQPQPTRPCDRRKAAQRDHERDRIEEVAVAVLEPAAAVVEEGRDQDERPPPRAATTTRDRRQSARMANSSPGLVIRTDIPRPSGLKKGNSGSDWAGGTAGSPGSSGRGPARTAPARAAPRASRAASPARSPDSSGDPKRTRLYGEEQDDGAAGRRAPARPTTASGIGRATRPDVPPATSATATPRIRVEQRAHRTGWRRPAAPASGTPHRRAAR